MMIWSVFAVDNYVVRPREIQDSRDKNNKIGNAVDSEFSQLKILWRYKSMYLIGKSFSMII